MSILSVLTLNIWNRQGPWERRLALIRAGLAELAPDVVGLQEVLSLEGFPSQADAIADDLGYVVHFAPAWQVGAGMAMGNAILSRHPLAETDAIALPARSDGARGDESDGGRGLAYALVETPDGPVPVFVTHLSWKLHECHVRIAQIRATVAEIMQRAPIGGMPPILMGDLNADPDADEIRYLRGHTPLGDRGVYFADCWQVCNQEDPNAGPGFTYHRGNAYALRSREPSRRIDYVFVRGPDRRLRGEPVGARVVLDQPVDGVWASDHYGVLAEIDMSPKPADTY